MTPQQITQRIARLEQQMDTVRKRLAKSKGNKVSKSWRDYIGMFENDPDFQKAVELGARWRASTRPKPLNKIRKK